MRSSELLEARLYVSDDGGNTWEATDKYKGTSITQLKYTWTNQVGTYLYVYNSHNMYYINNTDGEEEIGEGKSFTGTGFAWASIYGANISDSDLVGTIGVTVKDDIAFGLENKNVEINGIIVRNEKISVFSRFFLTL